MKVIRSLILCGCTADERGRCCFKSWNGNKCLCPCHYSQEETLRLVSAYVTLNAPAVAVIKKRMPDQSKGQPKAIFTETYRCGHQYEFETKPSSMGLMYIKQNHCSECLGEQQHTEE